MIKVERKNGLVNVVIPVANNPADIEQVSKAQAEVITDLSYLYKSIEDHYDQETLFFMIELAAKTYVKAHDDFTLDHERTIDNESDDKR